MHAPSNLLLLNEATRSLGLIGDLPGTRNYVFPQYRPYVDLLLWVREDPLRGLYGPGGQIVMPRPCQRTDRENPFCCGTFCRPRTQQKLISFLESDIYS
jgi:hypothetical protein